MDRKIIVKPENFDREEIKSPASPTQHSVNPISKKSPGEIRMAKLDEIEKFEASIVKKKSHNQQVQTRGDYPLDTNIDLLLDYDVTNHENSVLVFTVPTGYTLITSHLILNCVDVASVEGLWYLNSITEFSLFLGVITYALTSKLGQRIPYYELTPFSYYGGNPIAPFRLEIPENTPLTVYGRYTTAFVAAMTAAGTEPDLQYHFNIRLLGKLVANVG